MVRSLPSNLVGRGFDADRARLWVIDGGNVLCKVIVERSGTPVVVQRCQEHKRRNVLEHLPEDWHASVGRARRDASDSVNSHSARKPLQRPASLHARHPSAAASLCSGG